MNLTLRILFIEDSEEDVLLELLQIKKGGYEIMYKRVETAASMKAALKDESWDIIFSDYKMPHFNGLDALAVLKETELDIPFIVISGAIGEEVAVQAMKAGAHDYMMKNNLKRLLPTVERELRESHMRAERKQLEQKQKQAEQERLANLHYFESMDKINRAIQEAADLDNMMNDVLSAVLTIYNCDRASLVYPCDPNTAFFQIQMEKTKPEYPGAVALGLDPPMDRDVARVFQTVLESDGPAQFGAGSEHPLPAMVAKKFNQQSEMAVALYPKVNKPYMFVLHQCSFPRVWTYEEKRLFHEIGRRVTDSLTSLLMFRNLQESEIKYRRIVDTATEGIWILGPDTTTNFVNHRMAEMIGSSVEDIMGKPMTDFLCEDEVSEHNRRMETHRKGVAENYECRLRHRDGRTIWALASAVPLTDEKKSFMGSFAMFTDITNRKQAESQILKLNRIYAVLSNINQAVVRISDADLLLNEVCRIAIEYGKFRMVWIGIVNPQTNIVEVIASSGLSEDYLGKINIDLNDEKQSIEPVSTAIKSSRYFISNDIENDENMHPWREGASRFEYKSMASFPIKVFGIVHGSIILFSSEVDFFTEDEIQLLDEMSMDISFALESIEQVAERNRAEEEVRRLIEQEKTRNEELAAKNIELTEARIATLNIIDDLSLEIKERKQAEQQITELASIVKYSDDAIIRKTLDGKITSWNKSAERIYGYSESEVLGKSIAILIPPEIENEMQRILDKIKAGEHIEHFETIRKKKDGRLINISVTISPIMDTNGKVIAAASIGNDITERKLSEEKLITSEERYRRITEGLTDYLYTVKVKDGKAVETIHNDACFFITGYTSQEFEADPYLWFNMILPEERELVSQKFTKILEGADIPPIEHRIICKDGKIRWISDTPIPRYDADGKLISYEGVIKDITVHKQNEEALLKLKKAVDSSSEAVFLTDSEGYFTYINPAFTNLYGFNADEVIGKSTPRILKSGLYSPADFTRFWNILLSGNEVKEERINKTKDGKLLTIENAANPIVDEKKNIVGFLGLQRDISERKKAEELLLSRTILLETQIETTIDGIVVVDDNGRTIILNNRFSSLWEIPQKVIDKKEDVKMLDYIAGKLKNPPEFLLNVEYLTKHPDEKTGKEIQLTDGRFFDWYTASMLDAKGKNYGRIWFFRDITSRKMTELALLESEEKFRKLAETANDSIITMDNKGIIISWNKAAEQTFGYTFSEVSGKKIQIILGKKYKPLQPAAFSAGKIARDSKMPAKTIRLEAVSKDKTLFPVELSLSVWEANDRTYYTAIIRDISVRVKTEQELKTYRNHLEELVKARTKELDQANELLRQKIAKDEEFEMMLQQSLEKEKELSEMKSRFISTTSHEFRTPLTSILSSAELLQRYNKRWDEIKRNEHLNRIKSSVDYLVNLLDDVLTISRTEAGKITFKPSMVKLKELILSYIEETKSLLKENHKLKLNYKTKQEEFYLDPKLLKFIISNLLSNAIKYSPAGGNIELKITTSNGQLIIEVKDEGIGIPAEDKDSIFSAFYRTKNVNEISGTGLGLAIVKRAVDLHHGEIDVESEINKGTTIITKIPLTTEDKQK